MDENIKRNWQETKFRRPDSEAIEQVVSGKRTTALENLSRRYRRFSLVAFIMIIWSFFMFLSGTFPEDYRLPLSLSFGVYFLVCSTMDYWLYMGIRSIDIQEMTVAQVIAKALFYRKRHLQFMAVLIPMAIALVTYFVWTITGDIYMIGGVAAGAIVGLAIGTRQFLRFMADYRTLTE